MECHGVAALLQLSRVRTLIYMFTVHSSQKLFTARSPQAHADTLSQTQLFRPLRTHQEGRVRQSRPSPLARVSSQFKGPTP